MSKSSSGKNSKKAAAKQSKTPKQTKRKKTPKEVEAGRQKKIAVGRANILKYHDRRRKADWVKIEKYKANRLAGMNRYQSAKLAGYSETYARAQTKRIDRLANIGIMQALENAGATTTIMAQELVGIARNAMKRESCTIEIRQDGDEITVDDKAVQVVPDLHLRKATWELIAKLKKQLSSSAVITDKPFKRLVIVVENDGEDEQEQGDDESERRTNKINQASRLCVETADE